MNLLLLFLGAACAGPKDDSTTAATDACGDVDGPGTDTGNIPNLLGFWSSSYGAEFYDDGTCAVENLTRDSESWIGSFEVVGSPSSSFYLTFSDRPDEKYWGALDPNGGVTFTGSHDHSAGTLYASFGGLAFHDQYQDRDNIVGSSVFGMDTNQDAIIDCTVKGSWNAYKSGV